VPAVDGDSPLSHAVLGLLEAIGGLAGELGKELALELVLGLEEDRAQLAEPKGRILVVEVVKALERVVGLRSSSSYWLWSAK
jgi:hypothetical protein